jgi:hypothetical protein
MDIVEKDIKDPKLIPIGVNRNTLTTSYFDFTSLSFLMVTSNKLVNINNFISSLVEVTSKYSNLSTIFIDTQALLPEIKDKTKYYYSENFDEPLKKLVEAFENSKKLEKNYLFIFYGLEKLKSQMTDFSSIEKLLTIIKNNDSLYALLCDSAKSLKSLDFESWYSAVKTNTDGLWVGRGLSDQSLFKITTINKEMSKNYANNYGYLVTESLPELTKLLEFNEPVKEEEDEE